MLSSPHHKKAKRSLYIRGQPHSVGYRARRLSYDVNTLDLETFSPQGLVIPLFSKNDLGTGKPIDKGFEDEVCIRYCGLLDLDLDFKPFTQKVCLPFTNAFQRAKEAKKASVKKIKEIGLQEWLKVCPEFKKMYDVAEKAAKEKDGLVFFTGGKGFRVLWFDPKMYRCMKFKDQSKEASNLVNTVFPDYFSCWDEMKSYVDKNPYEKEKGLKPDIAAHPNTGLYPCYLNKNGTDLDKSLVAGIKKFWKNICENVPTEWKLPETIIGSSLVSKKRKHHEIAPKTFIVGTNTDGTYHRYFDKALQIGIDKGIFSKDSVIDKENPIIDGSTVRIARDIKSKCPFGLVHQTNCKFLLNSKGSTNEKIKSNDVFNIP